MWSMNCLPFLSTRVHYKVLVGFVLLDLYLFSVLYFIVWPLHCLSFLYLWLIIPL